VVEDIILIAFWNYRICDILLKKKGQQQGRIIPTLRLKSLVNQLQKRSRATPMSFLT